MSDLIRKYMNASSDNKGSNDNLKYQKLVKLFNDKTDLSLDDYFGENQMEDIKDSYDLYDILIDENAMKVEMIYFSKAMKYLMENDNSLSISTELAYDMGYTLDNINSELLATILATSKNEEEIYLLRDDIDEILKS